MKFKIQAGAELDLLTKDELTDALRAWTVENRRGARFRRFLATGLIDSGAVSIGGPEDASADPTGPPDGFFWDVRRLSVYGLADGDALAVYVNNDQPGDVILPLFDNYVLFPPRSLVLAPGDQMVFVGASLNATGTVTITGQAREIPESQQWML